MREPLTSRAARGPRHYPCPYRPSRSKPAGEVADRSAQADSRADPQVEWTSVEWEAGEVGPGVFRPSRRSRCADPDDPETVAQPLRIEVLLGSSSSTRQDDPLP